MLLMGEEKDAVNRIKGLAETRQQLCEILSSIFFFHVSCLNSGGGLD